MVDSIAPTVYDRLPNN